MLLLENRAIRVPDRVRAWDLIYPVFAPSRPGCPRAWDRALHAVEDICSS